MAAHHGPQPSLPWSKTPWLRSLIDTGLRRAMEQLTAASDNRPSPQSPLHISSNGSTTRITCLPLPPKGAANLQFVKIEPRAGWLRVDFYDGAHTIAATISAAAVRDWSEKHTARAGSLDHQTGAVCHVASASLEVTYVGKPEIRLFIDALVPTTLPLDVLGHESTHPLPRIYNGDMERLLGRFCIVVERASCKRPLSSSSWKDPGLDSPGLCTQQQSLSTWAPLQEDSRQQIAATNTASDKALGARVLDILNLLPTNAASMQNPSKGQQTQASAMAPENGNGTVVVTGQAADSLTAMAEDEQPIPPTVEEPVREPASEPGKESERNAPVENNSTLPQASTPFAYRDATTENLKVPDKDQMTLLATNDSWFKPLPGKSLPQPNIPLAIMQDFQKRAREMLQKRLDFCDAKAEVDEAGALEPASQDDVEADEWPPSPIRERKTLREADIESSSIRKDGVAEQPPPSSLPSIDSVSDADTTSTPQGVSLVPKRVGEDSDDDMEMAELRPPPAQPMAHQTPESKISRGAATMPIHSSSPSERQNELPHNDSDDDTEETIMPRPLSTVSPVERNPALAASTGTSILQISQGMEPTFDALAATTQENAGPAKRLSHRVSPPRSTTPRKRGAPASSLLVSPVQADSGQTRSPLQEAQADGDRAKKARSSLFGSQGAYSPAVDPAMLNRNARREFMRTQRLRRSGESVVEAAFPASSRPDGTGKLGNEEQESSLSTPANTTEQKTNLPAQPLTPVTQVRSSATIQVMASTETLFERFCSAYPEYKGSEAHFANLCRMIWRLKQEKKPVHPSLWDDFVIQNQLQYGSYVQECLMEGTDPVAYSQYYHEFVEEATFNKRVLRADVLQLWINLQSQFASRHTSKSQPQHETVPTPTQSLAGADDWRHASSPPVTQSSRAYRQAGQIMAQARDDDGSQQADLAYDEPGDAPSPANTSRKVQAPAQSSALRNSLPLPTQSSVKKTRRSLPWSSSTPANETSEGGPWKIIDLTKESRTGTAPRRTDDTVVVNNQQDIGKQKNGPALSTSKPTANRSVSVRTSGPRHDAETRTTKPTGTPAKEDWFHGTMTPLQDFNYSFARLKSHPQPWIEHARGVVSVPGSKQGVDCMSWEF